MSTSVAAKGLLLALLLITGSAWADWVKVFETDDSTFYIDPATIRKDGNLRKVWQIQNLKQPSNGVMSNRGKLEYDCKPERERVLALSTHSELMAGGKMILDLGEDPSGWNEIPPGTVVATTLKIVCAK